jgi:hypothetical protein
MANQEETKWQCRDFSNAPFFTPNYISCHYGKHYEEQTIVILDKEKGQIKVFNPLKCEKKKNGFFVCDVVKESEVPPPPFDQPTTKREK